MRRPATITFVAAICVCAASCGLTVPGTIGSGDSDAAPNSRGSSGVDASVDGRLDDGSFVDVAPVDPYRAIVLADGPVAYWRLRDAAGATTALAEVGQSAAVFGVPARAAGIKGQPNASFEFDPNANQGLRVGDFYDFGGLAPFSLEAWFNPSANPDGTYRHLFIKDTTAGAREEYGVYFHDSDGLVFERFVKDGKTSTSIAASAVGARVWHHVVATFDGITMRLYLDGALGASTPENRSQGKKADLFVGAKSTNYGTLPGDLAEVAIYDKALGPDRVAAHFDAGR